MQKSQVVKGAAQNPVFQWLSQPAQNGWCDQAPLWNFSKYLVNEQGVLQGFYSQMIPSFQSEWGFFMYVNAPNDTPFGFRDGCVLPQELKVVDGAMLERWANPSFMWRMALYTS